ALCARQAISAEAPLHRERERVVCGLHDERDDAPLAPASQRAESEGGEGSPEQLHDERPDPRDEGTTTVDESGGQHPHQVRTGAVAHVLDVSALVDVERGRDRDTVSEADLLW